MKKELDNEDRVKLQMLGQEAQQLEEQITLIERNVLDLQNLKIGLTEIEKESGKEILANIGKGIYIPAEIKSKELIVEVGNKNLVKKTIPETQKIIDEQIKKLIDTKQEYINRIEDLQEELNLVMGNF